LAQPHRHCHSAGFPACQRLLQARQLHVFHLCDIDWTHAWSFAPPHVGAASRPSPSVPVVRTGSMAGWKSAWPWATPSEMQRSLRPPPIATKPVMRVTRGFPRHERTKWAAESAQSERTETKGTSQRVTCMYQDLYPGSSQDVPLLQSTLVCRTLPRLPEVTDAPRAGRKGC
jgi:hypothetical protein